MSYSPERRRLASQVRRFERDSFKLPVYLKMDKKEMAGHTHNISPEGVMVFCEAALKPGTPMSLQFTFGSNICYLNVAGQVVFYRLMRNNGSTSQVMGIKFSAIRDWEQKILISAVQELRRGAVTQDKSLLTINVSKDTLALEAADINTRIPFQGSVKNREKVQDDLVEMEIRKEEKKLPQIGTLKGLKRQKKFTPNPHWISELNEYIESYRRAILECRLVQQASAGTLSLKQMRAWMIQLYPFIETFPKYIALNIAKAQDPFSRGILIDNVRVEKRHAEQWAYMAEGFGINPYELYTVQPLPEVDALTHWLWSINTQGTLAEAVGANTYAIEGVTQGIAELTIKGFPRYDGMGGIRLDKKAYWWMKAHAHYDDLHPVEALEIIKLYATTNDLQEKVKFATRRSLEYLLMALEACYTHFQP
jgi:pyrroloquinoline quinone (PQQ) biosynthesis protein C